MPIHGFRHCHDLVIVIMIDAIIPKQYHPRSSASDFSTKFGLKTLTIDSTTLSTE